MSGLQKMLDQRRAEEAAAEAHPCYSTKNHVATLVVEQGDEYWLLPWQHFVFGRHLTDGAAGERLILTFVAHEVTICGVNLGVLADDAANLRVERLRAAAKKYTPSSGAGPFIHRLDVRPVAAKLHDSLNASTRPNNSSAAVGLATIDPTPKDR